MDARHFQKLFDNRYQSLQVDKFINYEYIKTLRLHGQIGFRDIHLLCNTMLFNDDKSIRNIIQQNESMNYVRICQPSEKFTPEKCHKPVQGFVPPLLIGFEPHRIPEKVDYVRDDYMFSSNPTQEDYLNTWFLYTQPLAFMRKLCIETIESNKSICTNIFIRKFLHPEELLMERPL